MVRALLVRSGALVGVVTAELEEVTSGAAVVSAAAVDEGAEVSSTGAEDVTSAVVGSAGALVSSTGVEDGASVDGSGAALVSPPPPPPTGRGSLSRPQASAARLTEPP